MILDQFSQLLCEKLAGQIAGKVNATQLADEFNLRAHGTKTITRQTAHNWLSGKGFPDPGRLSVLASWLDIDLNLVFQVTEP
jgi:hypothetical protein